MGRNEFQIGLVDSVLLLFVEYIFQSQIVRRLTSTSIAFIATLVCGSVIYHRQRRAKAHRHAISAIDHERYDRFYHGSYSGYGIVEANNEDSPFALTQHTAALSMGRVQRVKLKVEAPRFGRNQCSHWDGDKS